MADGMLPIDVLGKTIKARLAAGDKAVEKADDHYRAAGLHLIEAKARVRATPGLTWPAFLSQHCEIGARRADDFIAIAEGRTTVDAIRVRTKAAVTKFREKGSALRNAESDQQEPENVFQSPTQHKEDAERERASFLIAAYTARDSAFYSGKIDAEIVEACEATRVAWAKLLNAIESPYSQSEPDNNDEEWAIKRFMFAIDDIIASAQDVAQYFDNVLLSPESVNQLKRANTKMISAWNETILAVTERRGLAATLEELPAHKKLKREELNSRDRKCTADRKKIDSDYFMQFGVFYGRPSVALSKLKADSLASGVDHLAEPRREQDHAEYTSLIQQRQLYEGACALSWEQYFKYRDEHPGCTPLSQDDLDYVGMWTAFARHPPSRPERHCDDYSRPDRQ